MAKADVVGARPVGVGFILRALRSHPGVFSRVERK